MATVRQTLVAGGHELAAASPHPRRDAELLLMHLLGWDRAALLTRPEHELRSSDLDRYHALLERRRTHEPMQYIVGTQEFFGLAFKVSSGVLIPRPETEHVVEALLDRLESLRKKPEQAEKPGSGCSLEIADVGTGSGAIAIALAHTVADCRVTAIDCSRKALAVAQENAESHGVSERVRVVEGDLLVGFSPGSFDAIVSNPPYVAEGELLAPEVREYEPACALYAGPAGMEVYERLIPQAEEKLRPGGWLILELGHGQKEAIAHLLKGWISLEFVDDFNGIPRVAAARKPG